ACETCSQGLWSCRAKYFVASDPPESSLAMEKITVPSASRTFHRVRSAYSDEGVSCNGYLLSIEPSSAIRPRGHHPPSGRPHRMAQSSAARSAPVCLPEIIFNFGTGRFKQILASQLNAWLWLGAS